MPLGLCTWMSLAVDKSELSLLQKPSWDTNPSKVKLSPSRMFFAVSRSETATPR